MPGDTAASRTQLLSFLDPIAFGQILEDVSARSACAQEPFLPAGVPPRMVDKVVREIVGGPDGGGRLWTPRDLVGWELGDA